MNIVSDTVVWIFWISFASIVVMDIIIAIVSPRDTFSRRAKPFLRKVPTVAYVFGLLPTHFMLNYPLLHGLYAGIVLIATGLTILIWQQFDGGPIHPMTAFTIGMINGAFLFPN